MDTRAPLAGWRLVALGDPDHLDVVDAEGARRATVVGLKHPVFLRGRQVLPVHLPDGRQTTLTNGTSVWGTRRHRTRGLLPLDGVSYVLQHRSWRKARLLRDGHCLAVLRRDDDKPLRKKLAETWKGATPVPEVELRATLSGDDLLALALTGLVLRPGRENLPSKVLSNVTF